MKAFLASVGDWAERYIVQPFKGFSLLDGLDILLLAILLYCGYLFFRGRRAGKLFLGLTIIFVLYVVSEAAGLRAIHQILAGIAPYTVILVAVIFQKDIRYALEKLGSSPFSLLNTKHENNTELTNTIQAVVEAACQIALTDKDGALIVIEGNDSLKDFIAKGYQLDAVVTSELLRNIFVDRSPLHDGAVIISHNRIAAAGSKLPLTENEDMVRGTGTRHRAAVGISEHSDCVVVVVSEERHLISIANNGVIRRKYHKFEDLQSEDGMKNLQNRLRNDLFKMLAGLEHAREAKTGKPVKERGLSGVLSFFKKFRFRFRWKKADEEQGNQVQKARPDAESNRRRAKVTRRRSAKLKDTPPSSDAS